MSVLQKRKPEWLGPDFDALTPASKHFVCVFHVAGGRTLLGVKRTLSEETSVGNVDGFGGRIEEGEHPMEAALRLWDAETGTTAKPQTLKHVANIMVLHKGRPNPWHNRVFLLGAFEGEAVETSQVTPAWCQVPGEVPYASMRGDLQHWLPKVLAWQPGSFLEGVFALDGDECVWGRLLE